MIRDLIFSCLVAGIWGVSAYPKFSKGASACIGILTGIVSFAITYNLGIFRP